MSARHARLILLLVLVYSFPTILIAQQRMAIVEGALDLAANDVAQVATYCLDFSRSSPTSSDAYNHVLTGDESATVHFDNGTNMPLQQALQQKLVSMSGRHITFADFLKSANDPAVARRNPLTPQEKKGIAELSQIWNSASPAERTELEAEWEQMTPDFWDHTHLQLVNHSNQHLRVSFDETTVLSPKNESLQGTAFTSIGKLSGTADSAAAQQYAWAVGDRQQQSALAYLGFYHGNLDGLTGPATKAAIRRFQASEDLPTTGEFDAATTASLQDLVNTKRLASINEGNTGLSVVTVTNTPNNVSGRYTVNMGAGTTEFVTSNPVELAQKLNALASSTGDKNLYIDLDSFTPDKAVAFTRTLRRQQEAIDPTVQLHGVTRSDTDPDLQDFLFERISKVETGNIEVDQFTEGEKKGFFRATLDLIVHFGTSVRRISISIISASKSAAMELLQLVSARMQRDPMAAALASQDQLSLAKIVGAAEKDYRNRHPDVTDDSYSKQLRSQIGTVDISLLDNLASAPAA